MINEITNEWNDNKVKKCVDKLKRASEGAALIKLPIYMINGLTQTKIWFNTMK